MLPKINNCYDGKTVKNSCFGYNVWKRCGAKRVTFLVVFFYHTDHIYNVEAFYYSIHIKQD